METSLVIVVVLALGAAVTGVARAEWAAAASTVAGGSTGHLALTLGSVVDPPAFSCTDVDGAVVCEPETQVIALPIANTGSLPGSLHLRLAAVEGPCEALMVSIGEGDPRALCRLLDTSRDLALTLDPGSSTVVEVVFGVAPTAPNSAWGVSLEIEISLGLWVLDGNPDGSWFETRSAPVIVSGSWSEPEETTSTDEPVSTTETEPEAGSSDTETAPVAETESSTEGNEEAAASDQSTTDDSATEITEEEPTEPTEEEPTEGEPTEEPVDEVGETPPDDEALPDDSSLPAGDPEEDPGTGEEPPTVAPDPDEEEPDSDEEPVAEEAEACLVSGVVWFDTDGDRLLVPESDESGVEDLAVDLLSEDGERIARVRTDQTGRYVFEDLPGGSYVVEIHLPRGIAPSDPADGGDLHALAADIAGELGIDPSDIVVDDTAEVVSEPRRYRVRSALLVVDGDLVDTADFALTEETSESPGESAKDPDHVATRPDKPGSNEASEEEK